MIEASANTKDNQNVKFVSYHQPSLISGDYTITVTQTVSSNSKNPISQKFEPTQNFSVNGPRFQLAPEDIYAVFPPPGNRGDYSQVLPHIMFNRSTLPWERSAVKNENENTNPPTPWLALLVFYESEIKSGQVLASEVVSVKDITPSGEEKDWKSIEKDGSKTWIPLFDKETCQYPDDKVTVIDIRKDLLNKILPDGKRLTCLAHVRYAMNPTENSTKENPEYATLIANRLPDTTDLTPDTTGLTTIHLVSVEQRFSKDNNNFVFPSESDENDFIRLISLKSWTFSCEDPRYQFEGILKNLDVHTLNLIPERMYDLEVKTFTSADEIPNEGKNLVSVAKITSANETSYHIRIFDGAGQIILDKGKSEFSPGEVLKQTIENILTGQTIDPLTEGKVIEEIIEAQPLIGYLNAQIKRGFVSLPHYFRRGDKTTSLYHGPFLPYPKNERLSTFLNKPPHVSDQLLCYQKFGESGPILFDTTYAAAWQLGRMLTLQNKRIAIALSNWKRTQAQISYKNAQAENDSHLRIDDYPNSGISPDQFTDDLNQWFADLALLKGIPFNYLVPDSGMLPEESIRFFCVDPLWVDCLLDGAFSLGQRTEQAITSSQATVDSLSLTRDVEMSGCLVRSQVVAGWPGLLVKGDGHEPVRMERLSPEVLLCLFKGEISEVQIYQKSETLHFGIGDDAGSYNNLRILEINFFTEDNSESKDQFIKSNQFAKKRVQSNQGVKFTLKGLEGV